MFRRILVAFAFVAWLAANLSYFFWYQKLTSLEFTATAAAITALFAGWIFVGAYFFPRRAVRVALGAVYFILLAWSLANFAYFQIFGTYLPVFSSRLNSLNLPMIRLVAEFVGQIPAVLALAVVGLSGSYLLICLLSRPPRPDRAVLVFASDRRAVRPDSWRARFRKLAIALGLALQAGAFLAVNDLIMAANVGSFENADQTATLERIGPVGYALSFLTVEETAMSEENAARPDRSDASLETSKADVQTIKESLASLSAGSSFSNNPVRPAAAARHVIVYQLESAAAWALEQEPSPMPFLSALIGRYGTVENYFANGCTTIDAEFAINCGYLPETYGPVSDLYSKNSYQCLPQILKDKGYGTYLYHANDPSFWSRDLLAPAWGFEHLIFKPEFGYREPDAKIMDRVVVDLKNSDAPTFQYVIGLNGHGPHDKHFQNFYADNFALDIKPYSGELNGTAEQIKADEATVRRYLGFLRTADDGLRRLFERLEAEGLADETMVVVVGDHRYYQSSDPDAENNFLAYNRVPLLIAAPGAASAAWPKIASHNDIAPTVFDYLTEGRETLPPAFIGTSLYSSEHRDAAVNKCLGRASFYDGAKLVEAYVPQGTSQVKTFGGQEPDAKAVEADGRSLLSLAATSDLLLARDGIGRGAGANEKTGSADVNTDSDNDGLSDLREAVLGTDPHNFDTDGDGYSDGEEVMNGYDPLGTGKKLLIEQ